MNLDNFDKFLFISFLFFIDFSYCENSVTKCSSNQPFRLIDSTCGSFEDACLKKEDKQCNNLRNACQQCPSTNYTLPMLIDILKVLKTEIIDTKLNQTNEITTIKNSINSLINLFTSNIQFLKGQLTNNVTLVLKKEIDQLSGSLESIKSLFTNETNSLKNKLVAFQKNQSAEFRTMKNELVNKISKLQREIEKPSDVLINKLHKLQREIEKPSGITIAVLVIEIITVIILLLEVRFKIISKAIGYIKTDSPSNPCSTSTTHSNQYRPLWKSRKVNSLTECKDEILRKTQDLLNNELTGLKNEIKSMITSEIGKWIQLNQRPFDHPYSEENIEVQSHQISNDISGTSPSTLTPCYDGALIPEETSSN